MEKPNHARPQVADEIRMPAEVVYRHPSKDPNRIPRNAKLRFERQVVRPLLDRGFGPTYHYILIDIITELRKEAGTVLGRPEELIAGFDDARAVKRAERQDGQGKHFYEVEVVANVYLEVLVAPSS